MPRGYSWTGVTCFEGSRIRVVALYVGFYFKTKFHLIVLFLLTYVVFF